MIQPPFECLECGQATVLVIHPDPERMPPGPEWCSEVQSLERRMAPPWSAPTTAPQPEGR